MTTNSQCQLHNQGVQAGNKTLNTTVEARLPWRQSPLPRGQEQHSGGNETVGEGAEPSVDPIMPTAAEDHVSKGRHESSCSRGVSSAGNRCPVQNSL